MTKRSFHAAVFLLVFVMTLCACTAENPQSGAGTGTECYVYYPNVRRTAVIAVKHTLADRADAVDEFIACLKNPPLDPGYQAVIGGDLQLEDVALQDGILSLYFSKTYAELDAGYELLVRASLVKTLSQADGVDFVAIYSGGHPLKDKKGAGLPPFSADDFITGVSDRDYVERQDMVLYFAGADGKSLVPERRSVLRGISCSCAEAVLSELLRGPQDEALTRTINQKARLLDVRVSGSICYVNFDSSFQNGCVGVDDKAALYAVVNTLTELAQIHSVCICVDGMPLERFGNLELSGKTLERDLDI